MRFPLVLFASISLSLLVGCTTPSAVLLPKSEKLPDSASAVYSSQGSIYEMRIQPGDTLRINRDAQFLSGKESDNLYLVRADGTFSYPFVGKVSAGGKTLEAISAYMTEKLASFYRDPNITVNIASSSNNHVYVGGAVRNSSAIELHGSMSIEQVLISAGGVLPTADSQHVALLRMNADGRYDIFLHDFSALLQPTSGGRAPLILQRGDIVFVPKSNIGNAVEGVDLYVNQLLPFSRSFGIGLSYGTTVSTIKP